MRSLRLRLVVGWLLWTAGLLAIAHMLFLAFGGQHVFSLRISRPGVVLVALALMGAGLLLVRKGVSPLQALRSRLVDVREGRAARLEGSYPSEVQPLAADLNALLDQREQAVRRAVAKAGDLAHGLKTPLAVLAQEADRAEAAGQHETAAALREQIERMRRQVDYHLAHARAAASGGVAGARSSVSESAEGLARTLRRLHADRGLVLEVRVPAAHAVRAGREDLDEMLGNLLENGCKWARSRVAVTSVGREGFVDVTVEDDGPGLARELREKVLLRGVRADEKASGSGFGLAIVRDLAELYGGSITLEAAAGGGLQARLRLPA
jgi:signal transduction histidine kinase